MALKIRDDDTARARDRLAAGDFLRPKPAPGVQVNVLQQNNGLGQVAGYVIDLTPKEHKPAIEGTVVDITPRGGNVGHAAADLERERAEDARVRPSRG